MQINNVLFNCDLYEILNELEEQLAINHIDLKLKQRDSGDDIMICCPYHHENNPSAGIRKSDGLFHCFACGEVHTLYEVITHCFGHTDDVLGKFGWNWLLKNFATLQVEERKPIDLRFDRYNSKHNSRTDNSRDCDGNRYVLEEELDSYRYYHPYMYKRGLTDEVIELFDIGYDKDTDCLTFPVRDADGNTLFVARRSTKTKFFNYPKDVEKPLYGLYEIKLAQNKAWFYENVVPSITESINNRIYSVIICESMLDALSFWRIGKFAVALNGTGTELQFKQLRELPCRKLILCTDSDSAGMKARQKIRDNVKNKLISEYILPRGRKDANECTDDELRNMIEVF